MAEAQVGSSISEQAPSISQPQSQTTHFRLTHVLRGHTSDVRSVATTLDPLSGREALLSGSRDETAIYSSRPQDDPRFEQASRFQGKRFCNAVDFVPAFPELGLPRGQVLMGSLDSQIRCFDPLRPDKPLQVLSDHWDNVSVIHASATNSAQDRTAAFISASWDKTARVWIWEQGKWVAKCVLRGHDEAVWGVQIVEPPTRPALEARQEEAPQGKYLTSSADLFIRLFHGETLHAVYAGHTDVVRSLQLLPTLPSSSRASWPNHSETPFYPGEQLFASASNDGTIRVWSLDPRRSPTPGNGGEALRVLRGHTSLVYDLAAFVERDTHAPRLVSSGEDGTFRVWNWDSAELLQTIAVPVVSVWAIAVLPHSQDVVVGCSDSLVRVYSTPTASDTPAQSSNGSGAPLSASEAAAENAKACEIQQSLSTAVLARDATETPATGEQARQLFKGQRYDFVLSIDVADDAEPLALPLNRRDDRNKVASDFVALHNLPQSYVERIVEFITLVVGSS